ncbi:uncharacterized protein LOC141815557 [Curcuma longa]|uniref:uncharacterized protein LOC141815557 n=1 Tax=Curcuma longa TaxID=136217 RepID=UPI003D9E1DD2
MDQSTESKQEDNHAPRRRRRRRLRLLGLISLLLLILLTVIAVVLALTVFKIREPSTVLVFVRVLGASPRISLPAMRLDLNLSLELNVRVHNPNYASFSHGSGGLTRLRYRGAQVGEAAVAPGRVPARGTEMVRLAATVEVDQNLTEAGQLVQDVASGVVAIDAETRMPGRVTVLGFVRLHAVVTTNCRVVFGVANLSVTSQQCTHDTRL